MSCAEEFNNTLTAMLWSDLIGFQNIIFDQNIKVLSSVFGS